MAEARLTGFDDINELLRELQHPERMAMKAVDAAAPIVEERLKANIKSVANRKDKYGRPYSTGELAESIGRTKARTNSRGVFSAVRPIGEDSRGMRNAEKMAYLENGVMSHGQEPRPVRGKTIAEVRDECEKIMEETINEGIGKIWG